MGQKKSPAHFAKQAQEAYELSIAGYSQRQIAEKMGVALATVQRRLALYIKDTTMPKAEEYRTRQISRLELYIRSMWSQINMGDPKAVMAAVRTEERIAKLMGTDSATAFVVKQERIDDATEVQKMIDHFFGTETAPERKTIAGEVITTNGHTRRVRPKVETAPIRYATTATDEFAKDTTFEPHEVQPEAITLGDDSDFEAEPAPQPKPRRRGKPIPNPAHQFLVDSDD